jgi:predicted nucleic acid-binding protein
MLSDTVIGLAIAAIVISSVAWVSQFRRIKANLKLRKAIQAERHAHRASN